jgi:Flp pilus assembly protein TadG
MRSKRKRRRGAEILEMAIVLPLFLLLVFGIIEFGRLMIVLEIVTNAAREGARRAVVAGSNDTQVFTTVDNYLSQSDISGYTRSIAPSLADASRGDPVTVTVSVPYSAVDWGIMFFLSDNTLNARVTMRKE